MQQLIDLVRVFFVLLKRCPKKPISFLLHRASLKIVYRFYTQTTVFEYFPHAVFLVIMDHWGNISALNVQFLHNKRLDLLKSKHKFQQIFRQIACRIFMHPSLPLPLWWYLPEAFDPFSDWKFSGLIVIFPMTDMMRITTTRINKIFELLPCVWVWILAAN